MDHHLLGQMHKEYSDQTYLVVCTTCTCIYSHVCQQSQKLPVVGDLVIIHAHHQMQSVFFVKLKKMVSFVLVNMDIHVPNHYRLIHVQDNGATLVYRTLGFYFPDFSLSLESRTL